MQGVSYAWLYSGGDVLPVTGIYALGGARCQNPIIVEVLDLIDGWRHVQMAQHL